MKAWSTIITIRKLTIEQCHAAMSEAHVEKSGCRRLAEMQEKIKKKVKKYNALAN